MQGAQVLVRLLDAGAQPCRQGPQRLGSCGRWVLGVGSEYAHAQVAPSLLRRRRAVHMGSGLGSLGFYQYASDSVTKNECPSLSDRTGRLREERAEAPGGQSPGWGVPSGTCPWMFTGKGAILTFCGQRTVSASCILQW